MKLILSSLCLILLLPSVFSCSHEVETQNEKIQLLSNISIDSVCVKTDYTLEDAIADAKRRYEEAEKIDGMPIELYNKLSPEAKKSRHNLYVISKYIKLENNRHVLNLSEVEASKLGIPLDYYKETKASVSKYNANLDSIERKGFVPDILNPSTGELILYNPILRNTKNRPISRTLSLSIIFDDDVENLFNKYDDCEMDLDEWEFGLYEFPEYNDIFNRDGLIIHPKKPEKKVLLECYANKYVYAKYWGRVVKPGYKFFTGIQGYAPTAFENSEYGIGPYPVYLGIGGFKSNVEAYYGIISPMLIEAAVSDYQFIPYDASEEEYYYPAPDDSFYKESIIHVYTYYN